MIKQIPYIPPSMFYYWDKCPLKAVFYHEHKHKQFFPKHPDADIGSIIHSFYENKYKWWINDEKSFNKKWNELIRRLNQDYKENNFQNRFVPVQWYSNFYAVKKQLLKDSLLKASKAKFPKLKIKNEVWVEDKAKVVAGKIDMLIYNEKKDITEIIDFKTGKIFEKKDDKKEIKEAYKTQLALYAKIIKDSQDFTPLLSIIDIKGQKFYIENSEGFIGQTYQKVIQLKNTINSALKKGNFNNLAKVSEENCHRCNYRKVCDSYKNNFINNPVKHNIDVKGKIINSSKSSFEIDTGNKTFRIINKTKLNTKDNKNSIVYNLFFPDKEHLVLYTQKDTIIEYE